MHTPTEAVDETILDTTAHIDPRLTEIVDTVPQDDLFAAEETAAAESEPVTTAHEYTDPILPPLDTKNETLAVQEWDALDIAVDTAVFDELPELPADRAQDVQDVDADLTFGEIEVSQPRDYMEQMGWNDTNEQATVRTHEDLNEHEIMDTYLELLTAINNTSSEAVVTADAEQSGIAIEHAAPTYTSFEDYMTATEHVEPQTFEEIQAEANELPLEYTILQTAALYINEAVSQEEIQELSDVLEELSNILIAHDNAEAEYPELTLEITEQLMRLMQVLGYEDPQTVLLEAIATHGYEFLWDEVEYLINSSIDAELTAQNNGFAAALGGRSLRSLLVKFLFDMTGVHYAKVAA